MNEAMLGVGENIRPLDHTEITADTEVYLPHRSALANPAAQARSSAAIATPAKAASEAWTSCGQRIIDMLLGGVG